MRIYNENYKIGKQSEGVWRSDHSVVCYREKRSEKIIVVIVIEESKDLATMSKEELRSSLETNEERMEERNID